MKKKYTCSDVDISFEKMKELRGDGNLNLGIGDIEATKYVQSGLAKNKATKAASTFYSWVAVGLFVCSVYLSFTSAWWWFILGAVSLSTIWDGTKKSNSSLMLDEAMESETIYNKIKDDNNWLYELDEIKADEFLKVDLNEIKNEVVETYDYWCGIFDGTINLNNGEKFKPLNYYNPKHLKYPVESILAALKFYYNHHKDNNTETKDQISLDDYKQALLESVTCITHFTDSVDDVLENDDRHKTKDMNRDELINHYASISSDHLELSRALLKESEEKLSFYKKKFFKE